MKVPYTVFAVLAFAGAIGMMVLQSYYMPPEYAHVVGVRGQLLDVLGEILGPVLVIATAYVLALCVKRLFPHDYAADHGIDLATASLPQRLSVVVFYVGEVVVTGIVLAVAFSFYIWLYFWYTTPSTAAVAAPPFTQFVSLFLCKTVLTPLSAASMDCPLGYELVPAESLNLLTTPFALVFHFLLVSGIAAMTWKVIIRPMFR